MWPFEELHLPLYRNMQNFTNYATGVSESAS